MLLENCQKEIKCFMNYSEMKIGIGIKENKENHYEDKKTQA